MHELGKTTDDASSEQTPGGSVAGSIANQPLYIGRFQVERVLGEGSFGVVCLAHDDQLNRYVAIKLPHPHLIARTVDVEAYLTEARTLSW